MENSKQEGKKENLDRLTKWKNIFDIAHSIFIIVALMFAGYWWIKQGQNHPRVHITHDIACKNIHKKNNLVHVMINIKNIGQTPIKVNKSIVNVQQVTPLTEDLIRDIETGKSIIDRNYGLVTRWPFACEKAEEGEYVLNEQIPIEVGETQRLDYDFLIPSEVTTIKLYSLHESTGSFPFSNVNVRWKTVTIHLIKEIQ
jgi:hypothetical protein